MNILISILIAAYNSEKFIEQTILSCLNQGEENYEIVISDDNSDDNTWNIIQKFNNFNIIKYKQNKNLGEYANRKSSANLAAAATHAEANTASSKA